MNAPAHLAAAFCGHGFCGAFGSGLWCFMSRRAQDELDELDSVALVDPNSSILPPENEHVP